MLHAEILARLKHPRPILINGKHFEARTTPVHFMMTSNHKAASIEICRLVPASRLPPSPPNELTSWHRPSDPSVAEGRYSQIEADPLPLDALIPAASEPNEDEPHVLISLALEDDQRLDLSAWETWLAGFPALAKYVKVQGVFKSHSTLLLLSLPVMVWDLLPDDRAYAFVAFIRSNNLIRSQNPTFEAVDSRVPVASQAPVTTLARDDAESCLSGTTYGPTESLNAVVRRGTASTNISRNPSTASVPYREPAAASRFPLRAGPSVGVQPEHPSPDSFSPPGPSSRPSFQQPAGSLAGSLRNAPSTASLGSLARYQLGPRTLSSPMPGEGISRTMILNQSRSSKKSVFLSDQDVPEGHQMAPHVVRRLEDYFQKDPDPSIAVVEHLASNLGVETSDIHVSAILS